MVGLIHHDSVLPFAPCCFQHFFTTTRASATDSSATVSHNGFNSSFVLPVIARFGKQFSFATSASPVPVSSPVVSLAALMPPTLRANYQLSFAVIFVQRRDPVLLIGSIQHIATLGYSRHFIERFTFVQLLLPYCVKTFSTFP